MSRVYIAGPMSIIGPPTFNFPAFDAAVVRWTEAGHEAVSPADLTRKYWREHFGAEFDPASTDPAISAGGNIYRDFLREDIREIVTCDAIALLPGWRASKGVAVELVVATAMKCKLYDALTMLPLAEETALEEAQRLVHGDRGVAYGHPIDDYTRTGRMWGAILGIPDIDPRIACLMMGAVKISREVNAPKRDNRVDLAGYAECAEMVAAEQASRVARREGTP